MSALIIPECKWAICIYHGRDVDFSKFIFPIYTRTTQLGIIRGGKKKERRFIIEPEREREREEDGEGVGKGGPCSISRWRV